MSNAYQPPGGANFTLSNVATNQASPNLKPQEGSNVEFGTKWDLLGGRLAATAAVYRSENKNELVSDGLTPPTFTQIGKRRVDGIELGLVGQVTPDLNVSLGFAHMDSEILQGVPNGANANQGGVIVYTPEDTFSSWLTYKLPFPGWTVGGGARYVDTVARSSNQVVTTNLLEHRGYWVADAMLQYDVDEERVAAAQRLQPVRRGLRRVAEQRRLALHPGPAAQRAATANLSFSTRESPRTSTAMLLHVPGVL